MPEIPVKSIRHITFLFKVFGNLLDYKPQIASFDCLSIYIKDYRALTYKLSVIFTAPQEVENTKNASILQIIFLDFYSTNYVWFFTDASKKDSSDFTVFAIYSPSLNLQSYRISLSSVYTDEALAILQ